MEQVFTGYDRTVEATLSTGRVIKGRVLQVTLDRKYGRLGVVADCPEIKNKEGNSLRGSGEGDIDLPITPENLRKRVAEFARSIINIESDV